MTVTLQHIGDTQRFAKYSSDQTDDAFRKNVPVIHAWIPFEEFQRGVPPNEIEVEWS